MISIEQENDPNILRQVALLLDRENGRLIRKINDLTCELVKLKGQDPCAIQSEIESLKELLAIRERALFGDSSEKRPKQVGEKPNGEPQKGHGPSEQKNLPILEKVHELDPPDRVCKACGGALTEMGGQFEESEEVTVVERRFVRVLHKRKKYRCSCNGCVETAPAAPRLIAGGRYSIEFAAEVASSKYLDHLPLERQVRIMAREGVEVTSQALFDQLWAGFGHLEPTYEAIGRLVLASPVIGADETHWRLMGGGEDKRHWAWNITCPQATFYWITNSRGKESAQRMLAGYSGIVMADGYGAYEALARGSPGLTLAHCWAHVRRKFVEIQESFSGPCGEILDLIGKLYAIEREAPRTPEALPLRRELRATQSREVIGKISRWAMEQRALPQSGLGRAIAYMMGMWKGLTVFLENPEIPLDNNATERALRGPVIGRKNHYGSRSERGTKVAALFYTLLETAKLAGVEPKAYLVAALRRAIQNPGTVTLPTPSAEN